MTTERIDVIGILSAIQRRLDTSFGHNSFPEFEKSRAAIAELIEAAENMDRGLIEPDDHKHQGIYTFQRSDVEAFRAALARVGAP